MSTSTNQGNGLRLGELAKLPEKEELDQKRLAEVLGVTPRTIRRMTQRFELPAPIKMRGRAVWFAGRVLKYIEDAMELAERESLKERERIKKLSA